MAGTALPSIATTMAIMLWQSGFYDFLNQCRGKGTLVAMAINDGNTSLAGILAELREMKSYQKI